MYRVCSQCKLEKPPTEFFREKRVASGLHAECKECTKAAKTRWAKRNADYTREYALTRHKAIREQEILRMRKYKLTEHYRLNVSPRQAEKDWDKCLVRKKTYYAIKTGKLVRQPCIKCGAFAQAHHPDYSRPLDVIWLCRDHHAEEHRLVRIHERMAEVLI